MKLKNQTILVTGAGGFIGSHLVEHLVQQGCQVRALLHYDARPHKGNLEFLPAAVLDQVEIRVGDIQDPFFVHQLVQGCQVVFHLAALIGIPYSYIAPASYVNTNIQGTLNILQACLAHQVQRLVHTSTSECYGSALYTPIDEKHPLQGQSPYSASKIGADKLAESFYCSFGLPITTVRPFNTYGPRQSMRAIIPTVLTQLISKAPVLKIGSLDPVRDFNYVSDTVHGFIACAESDQTIGQIVNIGSGQAVTIGQLVEIAMRTLNWSVPIEQDMNRIRPPQSEVMALICDHSLATQLTNWQPQVSLAEGLQKTADFIKQQIALYNPQEYTI